MRVLCLGDVVGTVGVAALRKKLPELKKQYAPDLIIANGENAGDGMSITENSAEGLFAAGVDVITGGNHSLRSRDMSDLYERQCGVLRPENLHPSAPGSGVYVYDKGKYSCVIVNLIGNAFLDMAFESPFLAADKILKENEHRIVLIDFHAEATSEKVALGRYLDGRASLVFGTHTHVPTADEEILPGGTAYITDIGMCGPIDAVLGIKPESSVRFLISHLRSGIEIAKGPCKIQGICVEIDDVTGKALSIERFDLR